MATPSDLPEHATGNRSRGRRGPLPQLLLTREDAARACGMSVDSFKRHVEPDLRIVRVSAMRRVPVAELEAWIEQRAARLPDGLR
jgi:hypothetical protein